MRFFVNARLSGGGYMDNMGDQGCPIQFKSVRTMKQQAKIFNDA
jgi:hypothetical protein